MGRLFGTDGVRGIANRELTPELALQLGKAVVKVLCRQDENGYGFIIGCDTRISCDMLEGALSSGIASMGQNVLLAGAVPTPAVACLTRVLGLSGGAVISASHNPAEYNGIKFFNRHGFKISEEIEDEIEKEVSRGKTDNETFRIGNVNIMLDAPKLYETHVTTALRMDLSGLSIAMDCANGATFQTAPNIFSALGARVTAINTTPSGLNINDHCGSTHPEILQDLMKTGRFSAGLAFDGDGDRLVAVDETGEILDGDVIMYIIANHLKKKMGKDFSGIVATVMSNMGLEKALNNIGVEMHRAQVGDRNVLEMMIEKKLILGGEQSGHIIHLPSSTTGDGIISALLLVEVMRERRLPLSVMKKEVRIMPQVLLNVRVNNRNILSENREISVKLREITEKNHDRIRILVRPSGTEPLLRIMAEGEDYAEIQHTAGQIRDLITGGELQRV